MKIKKLWFNDDYLYVLDEQGKEYRQSLLFYPALQKASDVQRQKYTLSTAGIHWRDINEDVSYESFSYPEPTGLQRFFLAHKEINIAEFARLAGINATLLRNYINGFKTPSPEREREILAHVRRVGNELAKACF
ncbi:MAG: hypothetical protein BWY08_01173 [Bacteroidetes bacterium ADurb.Bin174]|jgi:hypothetical protein|nr:MAG: hypothetical protein BWY08_01173 [Bacteroidetes bacterium ADurb.Bin174]